MSRPLLLGTGSLVVAALVVAACGSNPEVYGEDPQGWRAAQAGGGGEAGQGPTLGGFGGGGTPGKAGAGGGTPEPCGATPCPPWQHCEDDGALGRCAPNDCATLACDTSLVCETRPDGALCVPRCEDDVDCASSAYCDAASGECRDDACVPGSARCEGDSVVACAENGSGEVTRFTCGSPAPDAVSACTERLPGAASCPCRDDWDCPAFTACDVDQCAGTGVEPSCRLAPEPMKKVLPVNEITWGGTLADPRAAGSPLPDSAEVVLTPVVANLDDDNGDGLIDERDFPEILFTTFCASDYTKNGTLRAIHGGGPNKGKDFFASCGSMVWHEGRPPSDARCSCAEADLNSTASLAVGDLDNDGRPEIVALTETQRLRVYSATGESLFTAETHGLGANAAPTLANLDNAGLAEIVVGRNVYTLGRDNAGKLRFLDEFVGKDTSGANGQGPVSCVADVVGDRRQEILAGGTLYRWPHPPAGAASRADCKGNETDPDAVAWCRGLLPTVWKTGIDGFCAVADVLGANQKAAPGPANPLDGKPELVLVADGHVRVFDAATGAALRDLRGGDGGGAPNVDDFDGDGFPEIGTAFATGYVVFELQPATASCPAWPAPGDGPGNKPRRPPAASCLSDADCGNPAEFACNRGEGRCVCLHNGWVRTTQDGSSQVTGSSVFDFNGDGAAEVIYNDECYFRVYAGLDGDVAFEQPSESRTRIEYPIVADVDNDGNAEIVFSTSNESGFCARNGGGTSHRSEHNNGIEVWGDAADLWVSARRVWNQHAYHVTNVTEGGRLPAVEPPSWLSYNGRVYNTYRSNPRSSGIAPDLVAEALQVSSPDATCGQLSSLLDITVQLANRGDLRVGPGVRVAFHGVWATPPLDAPLGDAAGPLTATLTESLEPGDVALVTVSYDARFNAPGVLPTRVRAVVDEGSAARECHEDNNVVERAVEAGVALPDLSVQLGTVDLRDCPAPSLPTTVRNAGSVAVAGYLVRYFAGNPSAGGSVLGEVTRPVTLAPGTTDSFSFALQTLPGDRTVTVWAVVDPDNVVAECNDGNNRDSTDESVSCDGPPR